MIVKLLEQSGDTTDSILSEFEWLRYLHGYQVSVVKPLRLSETSDWLELNGDYLAVAFEKVEGTCYTATGS
nr:hypothetical protein [Paenibacillus donghaensis]